MSRLLIQNKKNRGFTLIELIIAAAIFSAVSMISVSVFLVVLNSQQRTFGLQAIQGDGRFLMESIAKEVRMSNVETTDGQGKAITIINSKGETVTYTFSNGNLLKGNDILNSSQVNIDGNFYVQRIGNAPARVTITMDITNRQIKSTARTRINLETTVSSRIYY